MQIDADRAVAAGASWGGYAIKYDIFFRDSWVSLLITVRSWIQGHPEYGFNFKALVGHDGVRTFADQIGPKLINMACRCLMQSTMDIPPTSCSSSTMSGVGDHGIRLARSCQTSKRVAPTPRWRLSWSTFVCPRYSPSNFVDKWSTPQLLIHGSKDYRLPETESIGAFHALQQYVSSWANVMSDWCIWILRRGIASRLVIFPDENHWVLNHGNRFGPLLELHLFFSLTPSFSLKWHHEVLKWFDQFVGNKE